MNVMWKHLPREVVDNILEYDGTIRKRNGRYMNQLTKERMIKVCDALLHIPKIQIHERVLDSPYGAVQFTNKRFTLRKNINPALPYILSYTFNETQEDVYGWKYVIYKFKIHITISGSNEYNFIKKYSLFEHLYEGLFVRTGDTISCRTYLHRSH